MIDDYTPSEWVEDENLVLIAERDDGKEVKFKEHFVRGSPS